MNRTLVIDPCPCGTGQSFGRCCGPVISGREPAETAVRLMRSRYTAFARRNREYLLHSWHPETRPTTLELSDEQRWQSLEILTATGGEPADSTGTVRFVARYHGEVTDGAIDELSQFERCDGRWVYVSGVQFAT